MAGLVSIEQSRENNGLGNWHPARRPDSQLLHHGRDEHTPDVPLQVAMEGSGRSSLPANESSLDSEASSGDELTARAALRKAGSEGPASDEVSRSEVGLSRFGLDGSRTWQKVDAIERKGSCITSMQESQVGPLTAQEDYTVKGGQLPSLTSSRSTGSEGLIDRGRTINASPGDLAWDKHGPASTTVVSKLPAVAYADLNHFSRTNSFPTVPPIPQSTLPPKSLPQSQAENIMEEYEEDGSARYSNSFREAVTSDSMSNDSAPNPFIDQAEDAPGDFFASSGMLQNTHIPSPPDEEARFEEGLPLMRSSSKEEAAFQNSYKQFGPLESPQDLTENAEEDLFGKPSEFVSKEEDFFRPQAVDRKTTSQVLDSMHYPPHHETHNERQASNEMTDATGGGISVSPTTVIPRIPTEQQTQNQEVGAKDEDLAAKWQEALDDDELLEEDSEAYPTTLFEDDGKGSLENDLDTIGFQPASSPQLQLADSLGGSVRGFSHADSPASSNRSSTSSRYTPNISSQQQNQSYRGYLAEQATTTNQQPLQAPSGLPDSFPAHPGFQPSTRQQPFYGATESVSRPQMPTSTQSFADKAKGGYTSPYDLPMDVTRSKKRNVTQQLRPGSSTSTNANRPPAPPRSSSMFASGAPVVDSHPPLQPLPRQPTLVQPQLVPKTANSTLKSKEGVGGFFEELPSVKPRTSTRTHTPAAPQNLSPQPPSLPPQSQQAPDSQRPTSSSSSSASGYGLLPPGRISPYANAPVPSVSSKYSPASASQPNVPLSRTRYAASPAGGARAPPPANSPFQPRTSSPLARSNNLRSSEAQEAAYSDEILGSGTMQKHLESTGLASSTSATPSAPHNFQPVDQGSEYGASQRNASDTRASLDKSHSSHYSPPMPSSNRYGPIGGSPTPSYAADTSEPDRLPSSEPSTGFDKQRTTQALSEFAPPRRSQTQSPGVTSRPSLPSAVKDVYQRPASVNDRALPPQIVGGSATGPLGTRRPRGFSQTTAYIRPTDGREHDPLERWKGCPLFAFGFGGTLVTSFPKKVQRYAPGHNTPLMKCSPGEVKILLRETVFSDDTLISFPGPLKMKGKKKDVLEWLQQHILQLEQAHREIDPSGVLPDPQKRHEEKILLWKIMKVLVDFDGVIEGKVAAEQAVRLLLSPELAGNSPPSADAQLLGISRASGPRTISDSTELGDIETLRRILLQGEREKAVWHALDRRLWAHAMLISSTMDKMVWKQVLQEFIRQEVKAVADNTDSLAALYQIFAGNWEESVDELVPPSARAGLQFVSKAAGNGPTRNALDGLNRWRETLTLALSNRTHDDGQALVALGRLLLGYGRVEAAHICFTFAKAHGIFGGADDPQASVVLLGADHIQDPYNFSRDHDSILLTEVYEFACTVLAPSTTATISPHLQSYKLYHAMLLAECGSRSDAQGYCNVVTSTVKSTTKLPPYYHSLLFAALDDLVNRLRQAPSAGASSWMSKPSLDKVSGSFLSRVNQFIAGDESDAGSAASAKGTDPAAGPFAGVTGDTPNMSRTQSTTDLYNSYASSTAHGSVTASNSRYAPGGQYAAPGQYTPRSSFEQYQGNLQDHRGHPQSETLRPQPLNMPRPSSSGNTYQQPPPLSSKSSYQPVSNSPAHPPQQESHPTPPSLPNSMEVSPPVQSSASLYGQEPYHPSPPPEYQPSQGSYQPFPESQPDSRQDPESSNNQQTASTSQPNSLLYQPPSPSYEPPSLQEPSSYEPPSYSPFTPNTQDDGASPIQEKPKKKSFMDDDDDDFEVRAAAMLKQDKARKDREADEAFRKAAEADAQKGSDLKPRKAGWLGGWFSGAKKDGDLSSTQNSPHAPIKAKLGEESSFVYDKELKKWVNKKAGSETSAATAATPPPPKGPPSRAVSAAGGPPMRKDTDTPPVPPLPLSQSNATPPISITGPPGPGPMPNPFALDPASRTASPGLIQGEQGGSLGGPGISNPLGIANAAGPSSAPPSRPATGMGGASSLDDLVGEPQARKGGTMRRGKKGRGYVDVMASK